MIAQAIPSVSPGKGAQFFHKTECFCFEQQFLEPGESITIPLKFVIDPDLPKDISSLALGYTLFDITKDLIHKQVSN
jgi:cytochrome c oxidase assembly protein subunit 11